MIPSLLYSIMASGLGALAAIASTYSDSELETESEEEECFEYQTYEHFIRDAILGGILREAVRRVEYAKSVNYRNHQSSVGHITDSSLPDESSSESDETSDEDGVIIVENKEASKQSNPKSRIPPRVKGELLPADLPPIEELHITVPEYECLEIGTISSIVDQIVVVKSKPNTAALNLESVLFLEKGKRTLGHVFDVIGPVMQPFYCVRFNSKEHISEKKIEIGCPVFFAPRTEHTNFVFLAELMKLKGSDASWENDREPPISHVEYSDDEQERQVNSFTQFLVFFCTSACNCSYRI